MTYVGHGSLLIESTNTNIITDPIFSARVARIFTKRVAPLNFDPGSVRGRLAAVLISHGHADHLDYRSLRALGFGVPIVVPWGLSPWLRWRGFKQIIVLKPGQEWTTGDMRVAAVPARHFGGRIPIPFGSGFLGYVLEGSKSIYFAGDTGFDAAMFREIGRRFALDLALLPIGGYVFPWFRRNHMSSEQALEAFRLLSARRMMPIHFETFPASFEKVDEPRRRLLEAAEQLGLTDSISILRSGEHLVLS